ncbi:MAG TPA: DUF2318 domain-containing protein [Pyrinomonadaceae bacterium]
MSNRTHAKTHGGRERKREQFFKPARRNSNLLLWIVIAGLLGVGVYLAVSRLQSDPTTTTASAKTIQLASGASEVRIPLSEVNSGQAKFYEAALSNGKSARFFVLKTSDGNYRTALDACHVCFYAHKGYYQDGNDMVCRKCGRHFSVNSVGDGTSGCHPMGLHGTVDGNDLSIPTSELESGSQYF